MAEENGKDLIWFYKVTIEDIRNMKRQQWTATYYGTLTIAALIIGVLRFHQAINSEPVRFLIFSVGVIFNFSCIFYLKSTQNSMTRYRKRIDYIVTQFKGKLRKAVTMGNDIKGYKSFWYDWRIFIPLNLSLLITVTFLSLILYGLNGFQYSYFVWLGAFIFYIDKLRDIEP